jgi:predicted membrane protein
MKQSDGPEFPEEFDYVSKQDTQQAASATSGKGFHQPGRRKHLPANVMNAVVGLLFLLVGGILLLGRFGVLDSGYILSFWPAGMLVLGLFLLSRHDQQSRFAGVFLTMMGGVLIARRVDFISFSIQDLWPVLLILAGGHVLLNAIRHRNRPVRKPDGEISETDIVNDSAYFGGVQKKVSTKNFRGGQLSAMFGGIELDLRDSHLADDGPHLLTVNVALGGLELKVPDDWFIVIEATAVLGGVDDARKSIVPVSEEANERGRVLVIRGTAMLGGVEIRN